MLPDNSLRICSSLMKGMTVGLTYFKERGFRQETLKKFEVGYSFEKRDGFSKKAIDDGYKQDFLVKTGLSIQHEDRFFDRFSDRVMFPIHSLRASTWIRGKSTENGC